MSRQHPKPPLPVAAPAAAAAVPVEAIVLQRPVVGLRNPPCCGRPCVPRIKRTWLVGASRIAQAICPWCSHPLRITYEREADGWHPVTAVDLRRNAPPSKQR